jgi:histidine triad (HIT) family protein
MSELASSSSAQRVLRVRLTSASEEGRMSELASSSSAQRVLRVRLTSASEEGRMSQTFAQEQGCVFCRIVAGEIPATLVKEGERVLAFRDLNPQAPTHVLVIPRAHYRDVGALAAADPGALADLVTMGADVAKEAGTGEGAASYRLVFNTGEQAGQTVFHVHGHVLAGRPMSWPPG